ncbi:probable mediator of RNA polymerase II transcription subunit 26c [Mercurialis annua]|uniref:probable mediator of RNA polymerase II transcription subunit 26c n=1 Tax=Mercurialis annua TaxID=3986 RepID=UPI00215E5270|nr:probable mediator of RNA polymerase II transcription subunit 26c [Mercurialis annua]
MDVDDFRSILDSSGVDVWTFINTAISVASLDFGDELKHRRDKIVEMLYASSGSCRNCDFEVGRIDHGGLIKDVKGGGGGGSGSGGSPLATPLRSNHGDEDDVDVVNDDDEEEDDMDPYAGLFDDEQKKIFEIKQNLEDPDQPDDYVVDLLQNLADMDITFKALKETDIGRHVNQLRKHPSNDVRRLVKQLVRKWKDIVDEWVKLNPQREHASSGLMADGDSPQPKLSQNGHHQVPDFAYSPNPHNGSSGSDKYNSEPERKPKPVPRKETPSRPLQRSTPVSSPALHNVQRQREPQRPSKFDSDKLDSARKRLQASYKEAENAKKQRTIQVMDIHDIPKPKNKNTFFAKNKGGGSQGRHW